MRKVKQIVKQNRDYRGIPLAVGQNFEAKYGVPGAIRTLDPLLRRQPLCPPELQGHLQPSPIYHGA
jgi:hypothetical protein